MRRIRLHHELYSARAIEEAGTVFRDYASVEVKQEMPYFELEMTSVTPDADEDALLGELANYALALTIEEKRG